MKILVYGIQHSCTRLVCGLLDLNKNIKIIHLSNPSGNEKIKLNTIFERRKNLLADFFKNSTFYNIIFFNYAVDLPWHDMARV